MSPEHPCRRFASARLATVFLPFALLFLSPRFSPADASGTWSRLPPPASPYQAFVSDPARARILLIDPGLNSDPGVWSCSTDRYEWSQVPVGGASPGNPGLSSSLSAFLDSQADRVLVLDDFSGRVWSLTLAAAAEWVPIAASPPQAHYRSQAVFDPSRRQMLFFGGS